MRVAVLTLTRDRLAYTRHCFETLRRYSGVDHDHYVLDQGSGDGTVEWLEHEWLPADYVRRFVTLAPENVGIHRGLNALLDRIADSGRLYDVIVGFDNDCELVARGTLSALVGLAAEGNAMLSPRIEGLRHPQQPIGEFDIGGATIDEVPLLGNICRAVPGWVFEHGFRFDEAAPPWGGDEQAISSWFRSRGGRIGYVRALVARHYETTDGQHARYPDYFARRVAEGGPA